MRTLFREYFKLSDSETKDIWERAIFSVDANVLLNLYRYTKDTQEKIFNVLTLLAKGQRLWISYQVASEFLKNRLTVIKDQEKAYPKLIESLKKHQTTIDDELKVYKRHSYLVYENLIGPINEAFETVIKGIQEFQTEHPNLYSSDSIQEKVIDIFDGKVGAEPDHNEYEAIFKEGKERYSKKIPPGYADLEDKKNRPEKSLYGDLIIWKQLIGYAKSNKNDIIFVTDDLKEDWWLKHNGNTVSARPELLKEFHQLTGQTILVYKPERFLQLSEKYLNTRIGDKAMKEVEGLRKIDEEKVNNPFGDLQSINDWRGSESSLRDAVADFAEYNKVVNSSAAHLRDLITNAPFYQGIIPTGSLYTAGTVFDAIKSSAFKQYLERNYRLAQAANKVRESIDSGAQSPDKNEKETHIPD